MSEKILQGAAQTEGEQTPEERKKISRRNFLKILGATPVIGAVGCTDDNSQKIFPYVKGEDNQVPGVSVWYRSTCTECSAGCGIEVRTCEGRAVKIEGSRENPINRGGLCAIGQSALQHLYDPDRIRQPLRKDKDASGNTVHLPISWEEAYQKIAEALKQSKGKRYLVSNAKTGALDQLIGEWSKSLGVESVSYEPTDQSDLAQAHELVFGEYAIPRYAFDRADVVLSFGADFLETWISPCEYARDWSTRRRGKDLSRVIHIEPRLSLTGGNADLWINAKPGSESEIARALLKTLWELGRGRDVPGVEKLIAGVTLKSAVAASGVPAEKILLIAKRLADAGSSLVISGGAAASTNQPLGLHIVSAVLNAVLGNIGKTVDFSRARRPRSSTAKVKQVINSLKAGEVDLLFVHGSNPAYTLPLSFGFQYAAKSAGMIVSFSSHLDETAKSADLILPANTSLESWGDVRAVPGVDSLIQPVMTPVFDTRPLGDMLMLIARGAGKEIGASSDELFEGYLRRSWEKIHSESGAGGTAKQFWHEALERGGYFSASKGIGKEGVVRATISAEVLEVASKRPTFAAPTHGRGPIFLPYPSVRSFDGSSANRPWLQELPDPVTKIVWDYWAEVHPETARGYGIAQGDMVTIRTHYGELNVPAYLTEYVNRDVVAVPLGLGHREYGRFAQAVAGGNAYDLLPPVGGPESVALLSTRAELKRAPGRAVLVNTQGSDSQHGRELARMAVVGAVTTSAAAQADAHTDSHAHDSHADKSHASEGHAAAHGGHGEVKQMYNQREHPLYSWAMAVDLAACTGCSACVVACYAENNIPVVGKTHCNEGREMSWLRIERYYEGPADELKVSFLPMMCQQCGNAPCEPVCPVFATYHNEEGLNVMAYNRCVGTRYCGNNCSYKVRRFNWFDFDVPEPLDWQLNPDVVKRTMGVMEKCSFCVQRISEGKDQAKDLGRAVTDGEIQPACVQSCPTQALTFGNVKDPESAVAKLSHDSRGYKVLDHHLNTQPAITYLEDVRVEL